MKKVLILITVVLLFSLGFFSYLIVSPIKPLKTEEETAISTAKKIVNFRLIDEVYIFNGNESSATVTGIDENNDAIIVFMPENNNYIVKKAKEGITKEQAISIVTQEKQPQTIVSVKLGVENNTPFWEVYYKTKESSLNYYYVDFQTGEWLKKIENL